VQLTGTVAFVTGARRVGAAAALALASRGADVALGYHRHRGEVDACANEIATLGRRYLATLMKAWAERRFIRDDLLAEHRRTMARLQHLAETEDRVTTNVVDAQNPDHGRGGLRRQQPGNQVQTDTA